MKEWKRKNKDIEIRRYVVLTTLTLWEKKERKTPKETSVAEESERKKKTDRYLNPNQPRTVKGTLYWFSASFHNWHLKAIKNMLKNFKFLNQLFKKKFHMILQMWYLSRPQPFLSSVFCMSCSSSLCSFICCVLFCVAV